MKKTFIKKHYSLQLFKFSLLNSFCILSVFILTVQAVDKGILPLIQESCIDCHDEDIQKGNLRLDDLSSLKNDPKSMHTWMKVYDKVASGKMPPPKKAFTLEEKHDFLNVLGAELKQFDQEKKESEGRVVLRRLSANEYKNAIQDLLHLPHLSVKHYLPKDSKYHGIENVADRQQIAYNQIAQYLEAAETSLQAAVALRPKPKATPRRYSASQLGAARKAFNNAYKEVGDKLILIKEPALAQGPWGLFTSPSEPGYYKIRFKAHSARLKDKAFESKTKKTSADNLLPGIGKQTIALGIALGRFLETFEITPDATVQECTVWLNGRERLSLNCADLPVRGEKFTTGSKLDIWDAVALDWFEIEGPIYPQWPPQGHRALFGDLPIKKWTPKTGYLKPRTIPIGTGKNRHSSPTRRGPYFIDSKDPVQDSQSLLLKFMTRAYRRPVSLKEVKVMQKRVLEALERNICFQDAMLIAYKAILCSPDFLYIHETPGKLSSLELATRLSLYLWRSIPDQKLMNLALADKLTEPTVLINEAKRMLSDPKAKRFIDDFTNQWLNLEAIYATTPDKTLYPEYHEKYLLVESLIKETLLYVREMVKMNLPIKNIVDSDFTFLNERLAKHYDIPNVKGSHLHKIKLPKKSLRGGIITQGSMMKITANGFTTSPIQRGIWVLERVLGTPPPPPPPNAGSVEPDTRGAKTIREQLAKHREVESCASCHKLIDPPGFALEAFDVMGGFRESYRSMRQGKKKNIDHGQLRYKVRLGKAVDATGEFAGAPFTDIPSFKSLLIKKERQIARNITERLVTQATGAQPSYSDRQVIESILDKTEEEGYRLKSIIGRILLTPMFLEK